MHKGGKWPFLVWWGFDNQLLGIQGGHKRWNKGKNIFILGNVLLRISIARIKCHNFFKFLN